MEINTIIDEILKEINFDNSKIKTVIKDEMIEKLKENFEFIEDKNTNTLESFKNLIIFILKSIFYVIIIKYRILVIRRLLLWILLFMFH